MTRNSNEITTEQKTLNHDNHDGVICMIYSCRGACWEKESSR